MNPFISAILFSVATALPLGLLMYHRERLRFTPSKFPVAIVFVFLCAGLALFILHGEEIAFDFLIVITIFAAFMCGGFYLSSSRYEDNDDRPPFFSGGDHDAP